MRLDVRGVELRHAAVRVQRDVTDAALRRQPGDGRGQRGAGALVVGDAPQPTDARAPLLAALREKRVQQHAHILARRIDGRAARAVGVRAALEEACELARRPAKPATKVGVLSHEVVVHVEHRRGVLARDEPQEVAPAAPRVAVLAVHDSCVEALQLQRHEPVRVLPQQEHPPVAPGGGKNTTQQLLRSGA